MVYLDMIDCPSCRINHNIKEVIYLSSQTIYAMYDLEAKCQKSQKMFRNSPNENVVRILEASHIVFFFFLLGAKAGEIISCVLIHRKYSLP